MTLTSAQWVRARIQDEPHYADTTLYGDGTATRHILPHANLTTASAFVPLGATAWTATGATFNPTGYVDFSGVISANSAFRVTYVHTIFSDSLIDERVSANGILGASLEFAYDLMFDATKRARWMAADGSQFDNVGSITALRAIIADLKEQQTEEAVQGGGFNSWAETQSEY